MPIFVFSLISSMKYAFYFVLTIRVAVFITVDQIHLSTPKNTVAMFAETCYKMTI